MKLSHVKLRKIFADFWELKNHKEVPPISLVPKDDPTTLFTSSGMQQLVPNLLGEPHSLGTRLYNIQRSFRAQDIEEIGDNRHTTLFEMMGNWSLGDYFKEEQLEWLWKFLTRDLELPKEKLYVTIFNGYGGVPKDEQTALIWKKLGVPKERMFFYETNNWWSRAGAPKNMPIGEPGGPDSEIFFEFVQVKHNPKFGNKCHPNCDCGRFLEIGNSVFIQYIKQKDGSFKELPKKNVDFGGGLERIIAAVNNNPDIFVHDTFASIIKTIEEITGKKYSDENNKNQIRIIADHLKASTFLVIDGVRVSNKGQGYVLRRLLRRAAVKLFFLEKKIDKKDILEICKSALKLYEGIYFNTKKDIEKINKEIGPEILKFTNTLEKGLKKVEVAKKEEINGKYAFDLFQTYGFPFEITQELVSHKGIKLDKTEFNKEFKKHQELSRTASVGMFKGGLADRKEQTLKYHTTTHLLHQALFDILGSQVRQEGSNITSERLRFDFYCPRKPTEKELKKVEKEINDKIKQELVVFYKILDRKKAFDFGAKAFFKEKYSDKVKIYFIGQNEKDFEQAYSKEFCAGPHVKNTKDIGQIKIFKFKKIGADLYRVYIK